MSAGKFTIEIDTAQAHGALNALRQQIKETEADNERLRKSIEAMRRRPWHKEVPPMQWLILVSLLANLALGAIR